MFAFFRQFFLIAALLVLAGRQSSGVAVGFVCKCEGQAVVVAAPVCEDSHCHPGAPHEDGCPDENGGEHEHPHEPVKAQQDWWNANVRPAPAAAPQECTVWTPWQEWILLPGLASGPAVQQEAAGTGPLEAARGGALQASVQVARTVVLRI